MPRSSYWLPGVVAVFGAIAAALMYLASNAWFGAGDLSALIIWSVPLGVILALVLGALARRLVATGAVWPYVALIPTGAVAGYLWTLVVAAVLGPWIGAFSFPVLFCWIAGGVSAGITAAWLLRPRSWPGAALLTVVLLLSLGRLNTYARAPEPRIRVIVKARATPEEVQRVWTDVLGRPTTRPGEHTMLPGLSAVAASGSEGESEVLTVSFEKRTSQRERDSLVSRIRRSPLVARVEVVPATDTVGVRPSVSY
jgi:hypothetical protein